MKLARHAQHQLHRFTLLHFGVYSWHVFSGARSSLNEAPNTSVRPTTNVRFIEHPPLSLPTPFLLPLFDSKSIELLTGSGEVLVCYIFNGGAIILKVGEHGTSLWTPLPMWDPFGFVWPLYTYMGSFVEILGPFSPVSPSPPGRDTRGWSALALVFRVTKQFNLLRENGHGIKTAEASSLPHM